MDDASWRERHEILTIFIQRYVVMKRCVSSNWLLLWIILCIYISVIRLFIDAYKGILLSPLRHGTNYWVNIYYSHWRQITLLDLDTYKRNLTRLFDLSFDFYPWLTLPAEITLRHIWSELQIRDNLVLEKGLSTWPIRTLLTRID